MTVDHPLYRRYYGRHFNMLYFAELSNILPDIYQDLPFPAHPFPSLSQYLE